METRGLFSNFLSYTQYFDPNNKWEKKKDMAKNNCEMLALGK